jgi:protein-arginine kinase activator protein McsA
MMPCNLCSPLDNQGDRDLYDKQGNYLIGLKQVGKTKYKKNDSNFERIYKCQDCGAFWKMIGNNGKYGFTPTYRDVPLLRIVKG